MQNQLQVQGVSKDSLNNELEENGFLIFEQWFQADTAHLLKEHARNLFNQCDNGVDVYMLGNCPDWLLQACTEPRLARKLHALGITSPEFLSVKTVIKDGQRQFPSPWHQDRPYWGGEEKYSLWIALDDCSVENGCLKIISGSHHAGELGHHNMQNNSFTMRVDEAIIQDRQVQDVQLRAGDALLFHDCLLHASHPNLSGADRWSLIATYRSQDIQDSSDRWSASLPLPVL